MRLLRGGDEEFGISGGCQDQVWSVWQTVFTGVLTVALLGVTDHLCFCSLQSTLISVGCDLTKKIIVQK